MPTTVAPNPTKQLRRRLFGLDPRLPQNFMRLYGAGRDWKPLTDAEIEGIRTRWKQMTGLPLDAHVIATGFEGADVAEETQDMEDLSLGDPEVDCVHWDEDTPIDSAPEMTGRWAEDVREARRAERARPTTEEDAFVYDLPAAAADALVADYPKLKRCSVNLALRIRTACQKNDLRVGQLLANAQRAVNLVERRTDPFYLSDQWLGEYIDRIEAERKKHTPRAAR